MATVGKEEPNFFIMFITIATLECLIHVGKKYNLPTHVLEEKRAHFGTIPDWEYAMEEKPDLLFERYFASERRH
jgi:hypothetical protein